MQTFLDCVRTGDLGKLLRKGVLLPKSVKHADKKMEAHAGVRAVYLHGCVGTCNKKVWGPNDDSDVCEFCGTNRYSADNKPRERVVHFPFKDRFSALLQCKHYIEALQHEWRREKRNQGVATGVQTNYLPDHLFFHSPN